MAMTYITKLKPEPMGAYSLSTAYGVNSLVMSEDGATAYISVKDVPAGTPLTNTEYWKIHTDLSAVKQSAEAAAHKANAARDEMLEIARNLTDTVEKSGNPVQAELVGGLPFDRVATALSPIQAGSGDPSPSNIRPISGWTGAELTRCGKNILPAAEAKTVTSNGITFISDGNGKYTLNGTSTGNAFLEVPLKNPLVIPADYSGYVHLLNPMLNGNMALAFFEGNTQLAFYSSSISNRVHPVGGAMIGHTVTKIRLFVNGAGRTFDNFTLSPMIMDTDAVSPYEPYQGNTFAADFGQTVYGGTLDWQTGVLTVEWGLISSYSGEVLPGKWISDRDVYSAGATPTTGAQIAYKLATPQTIQLTPQEIKQMQGVNTLYGDGSISMTGRADKALALEARIAALEAAG